MGLDLVELVMEVEDAFGIEISDEEATRCDTVGKLIAVVRDKVGDRTPEICLTSRTFYRLRRVLMANLGIERRQVRLDSALAELLPSKMRRAQWNALRDAGICVPPLELTKRQIACTGSLAVMSSLGVGVYSNDWGLLVISAATFLVLALWLSRPFAMQVPTTCGTMRRLALYAAVRSDEDDREHVGLRKTEIAQKVRVIVSEQLAVPIEELSDDASFVRDLGCD